MTTTALHSASALLATMQEPIWHSGLEPELRNVQTSSMSGILVFIAVIFIFVAFNYRHLSAIVKKYAEELLSSRRGRSNVFDESSAGDIRALIFFIVLLVASSGLLLSESLSLLHFDSPQRLHAADVAIMIGLSLSYYLVQLATYSLLAYTFTSREGSIELLRSFNASQGLLGVALTIPAILSIFYPEAITPFLLVGAVFYLAARMLFIFKGFRIFYTNFGSIFYFILYLCTLEIAPLIFAYKCSLNLVFNFL